MRVPKRCHMYKSFNLAREKKLEVINKIGNWTTII